MAIGISSAGSSARGFAADAAYGRVPGSRDALAARPGNREADSAFGVGEVERSAASSARARELRFDAFQRVERIPTAGASASVNRGIAAYLEVERRTVTDPAGGELVGIDFYV